MVLSDRTLRFCECNRFLEKNLGDLVFHCFWIYLIWHKYNHYGDLFVKGQHHVLIIHCEVLIMIYWLQFMWYLNTNVKYSKEVIIWKQGYRCRRCFRVQGLLEFFQIFLKWLNCWLISNPILLYEFHNKFIYNMLNALLPHVIVDGWRCTCVYLINDKDVIKK